MDYFETNIKQEPIINKGGTKKWLHDKAYMSKRKQLKESFTKIEYDKNPNKYHGLQWMKNKFFCANPKCKSEKVKTNVQNSF